MVMKGASGTQAAACFDIHHVNFYERCQKDLGITFTEFASRCKEKGNKLLHNKQFEVAMEGNTTMLVWLGKQRLDQKEQTQQTVSQEQANEYADIKHQLRELRANMLSE